jgi:Domain of unknown function (DUF4926)
MGGAMNPNLELLDVVELREPRGGHAAGTVGAVVELLDGEALVEIVDETGSTRELVPVPLEALRVRSPQPAKRRAAG